MKTIRIGSHEESVIERADYPPERVTAVLANETVAVLGYGVQGRGQSLNMRDNGVNVIVGLRSTSPGWKLAEQDGWKPGTTLLPLDEAARRGTIVQYLLSDAGQKEFWPTLKPLLTPGKALYFSHGFSIVFADQTGVVPPADVDVIMIAPKGSGTTLRRSFVDGKGINASWAVHHDATGKAKDRCCALGLAIGAGHLFATTFQKEVMTDLVGERGSLMGAIYGLWLAQYEVLREHGHSPQEAFNETVEEATQSLYPLIAENGMEWMFQNASTTAQRGALDWFKPFRDAAKPVFERLYQSVQDGTETRITLQANSQPDYRKNLEAEVQAIADSEMWEAGRVVRQLRPDAK